MTISLRYAARSSVGLVRTSNQDSAYAGPHLMVMCDGMGGPAGGDIASAVAVSHLEPLDADSHQAGELLGLLRTAVQDAHAELVARSAANPDLAGLGTTCIAVMRSGNKLAMVHVGDSRAYLLREGELTQVTTDHTFVQYLVSSGRITREQARQHPQRSVLLKTLGDAEGDVQLDESIREAVPGDRWLLCSDGLSGPVSADTLAEVLSQVADPGQAADELISLAERAGGPDNITAVVFDVVEDDPTPQLTPQLVGSVVVNRERLTATAPPDATLTLPLPVGAPVASPAAPGTTTPATPAAKAAALVAGLEQAPGAGPAQPGTDLVLAGGGSPDGAAGSARTARRRRVLVRVLAWLLVVAAVAGGCLAGYRWTQTQYYVTITDSQVAIYQGIPQSVGPLRLSHLVESYTEPQVADLDEQMRQRLEETVAQPSLEQACAYVRGTVSTRTQGTQASDRELSDAPDVQVTPSAGSLTPTPAATEQGTDGQ